MWGFITDLIAKLFGVVFNAAIQAGDRPDTVVKSPPPVLTQLEVGGVVDDDLVSRYHRRVHVLDEA